MTMTMDTHDITRQSYATHTQTGCLIYDTQHVNGSGKIYRHGKERENLKDIQAVFSCLTQLHNNTLLNHNTRIVSFY